MTIIWRIRFRSFRSLDCKKESLIFMHFGVQIYKCKYKNVFEAEFGFTL